jgi:DNA-directed RNA polymerase specialized sigma subunit
MRLKQIMAETGVTQQQVADVLGLSQVKISREEKKIMKFLRQELA